MSIDRRYRLLKSPVDIGDLSANNASLTGTASSGTFLRGDGAWNANLIGSGGFGVIGPAATQCNFLTAGQTGQSTWQLYAPASSNDVRLFNNGFGDVAVFHGSGGIGLTAVGVASSTLQIASPANYGWAGGTNLGSIDIGLAGGILGYSDGQIALVSNGYFDGATWRYKRASQGALYFVLTAGGDYQWLAGGSGVAGAAFNFTTRMTYTQAGLLTVNAPASGSALVVNGASNAYAATVSGTSTTGQSYGLAVTGGTNTADVSFTVNNAANTVPYLRIRGDGNVGVGQAVPYDSVFSVLGPASLGGIRVCYNGTSNNYHDSDTHNFRTGNQITTIATLTSAICTLASSALSLPNVASTLSATAGGATALPATPRGYMAVTINGAACKIAYY